MVLQFLFSRMTCRTDREPYITVVTLADFGPDVLCIVDCERGNRAEVRPHAADGGGSGTMIMTLVPRLAISAWTEAVAP